MVHILVTKRSQDVHVCIDGDLNKYASGGDIHEALNSLRAKYRGLATGTRIEFHDDIVTRTWYAKNQRLRFVTF